MSNVLHNLVAFIIDITYVSSIVKYTGGIILYLKSVLFNRILMDIKIDQTRPI